MVSHAHGSNSRTGGQVCAPIVARWLAAAYPATDESTGKAPEIAEMAEMAGDEHTVEADP